MEQWGAVMANPAPFVIVAAAIIAATWMAFSFIYGARLETKDAEISLLTRQRDDYKEKLGGATPDEAAKKIAELERRIDASIPRSLTSTQVQQIISALPKEGPMLREVRIFVEGACSDCGQYANDFADAFARAGWSVERAINIAGLGVQSSGLAIGVEDRTKPHPLIPILSSALRGANLSFDVVDWRSTSPQKVSLLITHRPAS